ncbi:hypothetical protein BT93_A1407 [Corymbia citriodora subsp. variegata]|nr:hypothetical protein BT93_A1407 [Corymbia citriodora subsp. variegata]
MPSSTLTLLKIVGGKDVHGKSMALVHHFSWNHTRGCRSCRITIFPEDANPTNINSNKL